MIERYVVLIEDTRGEYKTHPLYSVCSGSYDQSNKCSAELLAKELAKQNAGQTFAVARVVSRAQMDVVITPAETKVMR